MSEYGYLEVFLRSLRFRDNKSRLYVHPSVNVLKFYVTVSFTLSGDGVCETLFKHFFVEI